jgi:hypothetical protein
MMRKCDSQKKRDRANESRKAPERTRASVGALKVIVQVGSVVKVRSNTSKRVSDLDVTGTRASKKSAVNDHLTRLSNAAEECGGYCVKRGVKTKGRTVQNELSGLGSYVGQTNNEAN